MDTKADIRKRILEIRGQQSVKQQEEKSLAIQRRVLENSHFIGADTVFLYMDFRAEVQTGLLLEESLRMGKCVSLPKIENGEMDFYVITDRGQVREGFYGILEPVTEKKVTFCQGNAFMAVPGVAFTKERYRLGYGGGYYDRYLVKYPGIYTCGLAFECQMVEALPIESYDMRLCEIVIG